MNILDANKHKIIKKYIIFSLMIWITFNITRSFNDFFFNFTLNVLILYVIYCINKPNNMIKGLTVVLILYILIIIGKIFVAAIFLNICKKDFMNLINNSYVKIISNLIVSIILVILSNLKIINKKITIFIEKISYKENFKNYLFYSLLAGLSIIYIYYLNTKFFGFIIIIHFILINSICLMEMKRKANYKEFYEETACKYDELKTYVELNENLINGLRKQRHNYKNELIVLRGIIRENKKSEYEEMIDKMIGDNISIGNEDINLFMYIKETGLKYLFLHKYILAKNKNIHVTADVQKNIEDFDFNQYKQHLIKSLYTIIGIILDNAIEAASDSLKASIAIQIGCIGSDLNIYVINTYGNEPDMKQIKNQGYSTKEKNRGYGLKIVFEIVEKYSDILSVNTYLHNSLFTQQIIIKYKNQG